MDLNLCPCGSLKCYEACCKQLHEGGAAKKLSDLVRARFSAYAQKAADFIIDTTHPASPQYENDRHLWKLSITRFCEGTHFKKLEIIDEYIEEKMAYVTFVVTLIQEGKELVITERSIFQCEGDRWLYLIGTLKGGRHSDLIFENPVHLLPLAYFGEPVLRTRGEEIPEITDEIALLAHAMINTMDAFNGVGLAAPQVHRSLRLFVTRIPEEDEEGNQVGAGEAKVFINPKLSNPARSESHIAEGCLSIPGIRGEVPRPEEITVEYTNLEGKKQKETYKGWQAKVIMHENDHINGVLFVDRVSKKLKKELQAKLDRLEKRLS